VTSDAPAISAVPRRDWRIVGFYIFAFAAGGVVKPFLNLYLIEVGLSGSQIGVLQGGTAFVAVVVTPLIGVLADRTQRHRLLLAGIVFVKGLSAPLLLISNAWAWLATWVSVRVITSQVQDALMNRLTLAHLQAHKRTNLGSVRFWGALSFAATSLLAGWLARDDSVSVMFPLAGIAGTAAVLFVGAFPAQIAERSLRGIAQPSLPKRSPQLWFAFGIIFLFAFSLSGWETFGFVFLGEEMGAGNDVIGFLGAVSGLAPLPAFYGADWLIRRGGAVMAMAISFGLYGIGWAGLVIINRPEAALPLIVVQGFGHALFMISMILLIGGLGQPERAATDQMLAQLTVPGLASMIAQPASGWMFDQLGGRVLFGLDAVLVWTVMVLVFVRRDTIKIAVKAR
jgi:MFS family permease